MQNKCKILFLAEIAFCDIKKSTVFYKCLFDQTDFLLLLRLFAALSLVYLGSRRPLSHVAPATS